MKLRKIKNNSKGQQEIVGFVLIVVLVVIALMVFLVISVRKGPDEKESVEVENMLGVVLDYTTDCALVFEPEYDTMEDLIKSCYRNKRCENLGEMACDYLEETLQDMMEDLMKTESVINAYEFDVFHRDDRDDSGGGSQRDDSGEPDEILKVEGGECAGVVKGASVLLSVDSGDLVTRLRICKNV
ncbi:hypothetical protein CL614_07250 [archaeon]|nr:hypothetical protein [archaeon]|tara:strand:+ start:6650 stop:7204 length:555 start_codon:yes stop_codon:yes gene_type:complete